jgi:hypothetical protein
MRRIAAVVVALCLMAVSGARARAEHAARSEADSQELVAAGAGLTAALASRRDGRLDRWPGPRSDLRSDLRLAAFTIPAMAGALAGPRSIAAPCDHAVPRPIAIQAPARCSRGPPGD